MGQAEVPASPAGRRRRWLRTLAIIVVATLGLTAAGGYAGARGLGLDRLPAPTAVALPLPADTVVYDRSDTVLLGDLHPPAYQHFEAPLRAMGRWLPVATVAAEDPGFWNETGGSTITRRLVRLRLPDAVGGTSLAGKAREAYLAARVEMTFSKARVLELYLNALFYGNGAYGAQTAAQVYFGLDASRLDLAQAALLAGLTAQPSRSDPLRDLSAAKQRQRQVLDAMVRNSAISRRDVTRPSESRCSSPAHRPRVGRPSWSARSRRRSPPSFT